MPVTLIAASDIHLGRRPTRLPESLEDRAAAFSSASAWRELVREAVRLRADALLLAGDVVDTEDDRFSALAVIEPGVRELLSHGIDVLAVAGNHDVHALPRLAELLGAGEADDGMRGRFLLLGANGAWEQATVRGRDGGEVHVLGRSFVSPREDRSPLDGLDVERPGDGAPRIGLLHCDLEGGRASRYAPVARAELERADVDAWLLGHVHVPGDMTAARPIGYLGSLAGLDPGEPGERGAWVFTIEGPGRMTAERLHVAPLRWEPLELDLSPLDEEAPDDVARACERVLHRALGERVQSLAPVLGSAQAVGFRVRLTGRSRHDRAVRRFAGPASPLRELTRASGDVTAFVESIEARVLPAIDLEELARTSDPPGLLARALVALRDGDEPGELLVASATRRAADAAANAPWNAEGTEPDESEMRELLLDAGYDALGELLAQPARTGNAS